MRQPDDHVSIFLSPFLRGEETAPRRAFQRKRWAVGEGQPFAPHLSQKAQRKLLPLTDRVAVASQRSTARRGFLSQ